MDRREMIALLVKGSIGISAGALLVGCLMDDGEGKKEATGITVSGEIENNHNHELSAIDLTAETSITITLINNESHEHHFTLTPQELDTLSTAGATLIKIAVHSEDATKHSHTVILTAVSA